MPRTLLPTLLILVLLAPSAQAWPWDPLEVHLAEPRVGDRLRFVDAHEVERTGGPDDETDDSSGSQEMIVLREGPSRARDKYGIERDTVASRIDALSDGELTYAIRCHTMRDGPGTVLAEWLAGASWGGSDTWNGGLGVGPLSTTSETTYNGSVVASFHEGTCGSDLALPLTMREGDVLPLRVLFPGIPAVVDDVLSAPASKTSFAGRDALALSYDAAEAFGSTEPWPNDAEGRLVFVVAEGLPGLVEFRFEVRSNDGRQVSTRSLAGYEPGSGPSLLSAGDAFVPSRNPEGAFRAPDALTLDLEALELPFTYAEAFEALRTDPTTNFATWLAEHPDATLVSAFYDAEMDQAGFALPGVVDSGGMWILTFSDESEAHTWGVSAVEGASTPLGVIASPRPATTGGDWSASDARPAVLPPEIADGATLARVAAMHGIEPGTVRALAYDAGGESWPHPTLIVSQVTFQTEGNSDGYAVMLDIERGAVDALMTQSVRTTTSGFLPLANVERPVQATFGEELAALAAPDSLVNGAATAAGIGLLALVAKVFLLPLYTRLRRDRLLDNPVRARLYERIRAEPGMHRAEVVDFLGIGEGATRHHLAQLVSHKLVVELQQDGYVRYFAAGEVPPEVARREALLRAGSHRAVYELYARAPTLPLREAARELGMSAPSVHRAKKKLLAAGLLPAAPSAEASVAEA